MRHCPLMAALVVSLAAAGMSAQIPVSDAAPRPTADTLSLGALQDTAVMRDARGRELALLLEQSRLRQQNLSAERLPTLTVEGQAQYQSDVPKIPISLPGGISPPIPPHDTYNAHVAAGQKLYDPTI